MLLNCERLRKNKVFMDNLRWDVTPEVLFKPRFIHDPKDCDLAKETQGFSFYIDYAEDITPSLMVMKTYALRSKTIGEIVDVPKELLLNAVKREGVKSYCGMYPIDEAVEAWLKERLGLK